MVRGQSRRPPSAKSGSGESRILCPWCQVSGSGFRGLESPEYCAHCSKFRVSGSGLRGPESTWYSAPCLKFRV